VAGLKRAPTDSGVDRVAMFLQEHRRAGIAFCRRIVGDAHAAEDLFQDACLRFMRHADRVEGDERGLAALLYRTLTNLCFNYRSLHERRNTSYEACYGGAGRMDKRTGRPAEAAEARESAEGLAAALDRLPPRQRQALLLKTVKNRSYREIAKAMDLSEANVGMLVLRARQNLRRLMDEGCDD
jgi:RNA polymerase sigma-70 factor (ECF subfamily)